jgi:glycosyltransferase involved in cell wall biosynthesis
VAEACVYTLDPTACGGVGAKLAEVLHVVGRAGHAPRLVYAATERAPTGTRLARLRYFLRARPWWEDAPGARGLAIPAWPVPLWLLYVLPLLAARRLTTGCRIQVGVAGSSHVALPAAVLGKPFVAWVSTLYGDELAARADGGDAWAGRVLASAGWRLLCREERFVYRRATLILANGPHAGASIQRAYPDVTERLRIVTVPVDTTRFHVDEARRRASVPPFLLFVGRVNDLRKNARLLLEAFARVRRSRPGLTLVVTGESPDARIRGWVDELALADAVRFVGYQSPDALVRLYQGALLCLLPSRQEGLGIVVLEALACGTPVVSTRCGGPEAVIEDGETGRLTPNGNAQAFADAVLEMLDDPDGLAQVRRRCREVVRDRYAFDVQRSRLRAAFQTVYPDCFPA